MKQFWNTLKRYAPWLILLLIIDSFSSLLLWLSSAQAFASLVVTIALASLVLFSVIVLYVYFKEQHKRAIFRDFLMEPDEVNTEKLLSVVSQQEREQLRVLVSVLEKSKAGFRRLRKPSGIMRNTWRGGRMKPKHRFLCLL